MELEIMGRDEMTWECMQLEKEWRKIENLRGNKSTGDYNVTSEVWVKPEGNSTLCQEKKYSRYED